MLLTHDLSINYILILIGPVTAEKKILAVMAFAKALIEVTTEVDDDEEMLYSWNYWYYRLWRIQIILSHTWPFSCCVPFYLPFVGFIYLEDPLISSSSALSMPWNGWKKDVGH